MSIGSDWFSSADQYTIFQASLERSQLIIKQARAVRMEADIKALNEKYDGKKAAGIEADINKIADQKYEVTNYLSNVELGLKRMDDVRTQLLMAKDAIAKGSNEAFDLAVNSINMWIGRQSDDPDSLIANNRSGQGSWRQDTTVVAGAGMSVNLKHQFMGSDYVIALDNGQMLRPDKKGAVLGGAGGDIPMSKLDMTRQAILTDGDGNALQGSLSVSATDGQATFTDTDGNVHTGTLTTSGGKSTLTDGDGNAYTLSYSDRVTVTATTTDADGNPVVSTYEGTLKKGGLGLMNSWAYGDFKNESDPDAAATARRAASSDIDLAIRKLAQIERDLNSYEAGLSGITNGLDGKASALATEYKKVSEEELSAKQAERRAIETRFNIATNAMALASETTSTMIYQMFYKSSSVEKPSLTDVLLGAVGG